MSNKKYTVPNKRTDSSSILSRWLNDPNPIGISGAADAAHTLTINSIKEEDRDAYLEKRFEQTSAAENPHK